MRILIINIYDNMTYKDTLRNDNLTYSFTKQYYNFNTTTTR